MTEQRDSLFYGKTSRTYPTIDSYYVTFEVVAS
jgi:hypothetical protein